jgi:hypothetical protein
MSGFLTNLASLALGEPQSGAARLSLPPRFGSGVAESTSFETIEQMDRAAAPAPVTPVPAAAPVRHPVKEDMSRNPHAAAERPTALASEPAIKRPPGENVEPVLPSIERRAVETPKMPPPIATTQPTAMPPQQPAASELWRAPSVLPHIVPAKGILAIDRASPTRSAPLSQAVVASRTAVERETRPVVNVTIDRIEVRAPRDTPPQPPQRHAKAQPSVSLADYLTGRS